MTRSEQPGFDRLLRRSLRSSAGRHALALDAALLLLALGFLAYEICHLRGARSTESKTRRAAAFLVNPRSAIDMLSQLAVVAGAVAHAATGATSQEPSCGAAPTR